MRLPHDGHAVYCSFSFWVSSETRVCLEAIEFLDHKLHCWRTCYLQESDHDSVNDHCEVDAINPKGKEEWNDVILVFIAAGEDDTDATRSGRAITERWFSFFWHEIRFAKVSYQNHLHVLTFITQVNTISWIPSNIARLITEYNSMIQWYLSPLVLKHYVISAWRSPGFVDAWLYLWYWLVSLAQNFARTLNVDPGRFQWPFPHSGSISYWVGDLMIWHYLAIVPYCKFCLQLS